MLSFNYIDLIITFIFLFFIFEGLKYGFFVSVSHLFSFFTSIFLGLYFYQDLALFLSENFDISSPLAKPVSFLAISLGSEMVVGNLMGLFVGKIPKNISKNIFSKIFGVIPSLGEGVIITSFLVSLVLSLPINSNFKADVSDSVTAKHSITFFQNLENYQKDIFGEAFEESLNYITVQPGSDKRIFLQTKPIELTFDEISEKALFKLVNEERTKAGVEKLLLREEAIPVARTHAADMWEKSYFAHISPAGKDVGDRLTESGVNYFLAGENLALAPTVKTAHTGLMSSEGHKRNILDPQFKRFSIGVVDNKIYGKMFVQIFTD